MATRSNPPKRSGPSSAQKKEPPPTPITPADRKIGEGRGNLRGRASAFKRRRGTTSR